ncbi:hypothetical protein J6590_070296 [Homalodisca vitripennis]|nr:hypothetical protein J6590_070296 [Homalodisca vitripennis]
MRRPAFCSDSNRRTEVGRQVNRLQSLRRCRWRYAPSATALTLTTSVSGQSPSADTSIPFDSTHMGIPNQSTYYTPDPVGSAEDSRYPIALNTQRRNIVLRKPVLGHTSNIDILTV